MTKSQIMKKTILTHYKSVRQFAMELNIPYSTLVTALDRGIEGMSYETVIKMCNKLNLNPIDFTSLDAEVDVNEQMLQNKVMQSYMKLNKEGREKVINLMEDFLELKKYKK